MSDSDQQSIQERGDSYSSDTGSIDGYEDDVPSEAEDQSIHESQEEEQEAYIEDDEDTFRVLEDKRIIQKLMEEETLQPVPKELRSTLDCISKYEYARVIGMRAKQIAANSPIYIDTPMETLKGLSAIDIAELQFKAKKLPFIVRRVLPNGTYEDWPLYELENKNI